MKKRFLVLFFTLTMVFGIGRIAGATVLNFDDLNLGGGSYIYMPDLNYGGFSWDSRWGAGDTTQPSYNNGAHSGTQYLSNPDAANNLVVTSGSAFDFNGAWFAHPDRTYNIATQIEIFGYDSSDSLLYSTGIVNINGTHQYIAANFDDVYKIKIWRNQHWYVMDDFTYNENAPVPEPSTMILFGFGLVGIAGITRRKMKK